ncbi:MAG: T9SS type A sorting domain-containing protein, partial [Gemmatimonadetes bacterium]|nr:T9SS type A sorting domain-containing protein [Gemmatimonadota bacterium]
MKNAIVCLIGLVFVVSASAEPVLEGRVQLESGEPVADAQVRLFDLSDLRQGAIARAMTDGTGYFALPLSALTGRALPERFALGPNYPNPFNPSTIIPYQLAASSQVRLEVFNLLGQHIATLVDGERPAGFHTATWHATDGVGRAVGAGVYIYRMTVGMESQTGRMVLLDGQAGLSAVGAGAASVMPSVSDGSGPNGEGVQVYGLVVSGSGLVPYVDSSFRVESGMAPVELVVSSGPHSAGKATDDDCAFCDMFDAFNDDQQEEEEETEEEEAETDSTSSEGGPDLIVQSPSVSTVTLTPGQAFTLNVTVHNQGDEQAAATMLHYYRSNNATITSSDTEVGTGEVGILAASDSSAVSIALTAPVGGETGVYFYGACVDSVDGESNTDNNCSSAVRITVSGQETEEDEETTGATTASQTWKLYWTDVGTKKIQRSNLDGSDVEDLVTTGLENPGGLALDVAGGKMYWANWGAKKIQRSNLDGSDVEDLVTTGLENPGGLALDVAGGKMYWANWGAKKIQRSNLDGSDVEDLVTTRWVGPLSLALDVAGGKMYWTDQGTKKI